MNELVEVRGGQDTIAHGHDAGESLLNDALYFCMPVPLARLAQRPAKRQWRSSLSQRDLDCLLQVIETDLIPQLLNSYSPARHAPTDRTASP